MRVPVAAERLTLDRAWITVDGGSLRGGLTLTASVGALWWAPGSRGSLSATGHKPHGHCLKQVGLAAASELA
jgi:hypothetical protein